MLVCVCRFDPFRSSSDAWRPAFSLGIKEKGIKEICETVELHLRKSLSGYKYTEKILKTKSAAAFLDGKRRFCRFGGGGIRRCASLRSSGTVSGGDSSKGGGRRGFTCFAVSPGAAVSPGPLSRLFRGLAGRRGRLPTFRLRHFAPDGKPQACRLLAKTAPLYLYICPVSVCLRRRFGTSDRLVCGGGLSVGCNVLFPICVCVALIRAVFIASAVIV